MKTLFKIIVIAIICMLGAVGIVIELIKVALK
jgi:hypothetical protein